MSLVGVANRTRHGAGAVGADPKKTRLYAGDRAAAGADGANIDHRRIEMIAAHFVRAGDQRLAVHHQRHVAARATHVGGDDVVVADLLRQLQRAVILTWRILFCRDKVLCDDLGRALTAQKATG